jgi:predicted nucleic acid-binding Zn finger protein
MTLLQKVLDTFDGVTINQYGWHTYPIKGKPYIVTYDDERREWSCSCPANKWNRKKGRKDCKHITASKMKRFNFMKDIG